MSDSSSLRRQLQIKTGSLNRLGKEYNLYVHEQEEQKRKVDALVGDGTPDDEWDLKNGRRMLQEGEMMISDTNGRLQKVATELRDLVAATKGQPGVGDSEEYTKAEKALETASS